MAETAGGALKPRFKVNQKIVYPVQGVGHVQSIQEKDFQGRKVLYYNIYLKVTDMTVMIPVDKADYLGLRAIAEQSKVKEALNLISKVGEPATSDWKLRYQTNMALLKEGGVSQIATVVRNLYQRSKTKELPILERKLYDSALKILIDEVSFSLDMKADEVEQLVFSKLELN